MPSTVTSFPFPLLAGREAGPATRTAFAIAASAIISPTIALRVEGTQMRMQHEG